MEEALAKLPKVDKDKLNKIQKLETKCSNARAALQAMATGLKVVAADKPVKAGEESIKVGQQRILTEDTEVKIGAAIRLRIQPGGGTSLVEARQTEAEARKDLQAVLDSFGLQSVKEATEAHADRDDLVSRIKTVQAELEGMGAENLAEELESSMLDLSAAKADVDRLTALATDVHAPDDKAGAKALAKALAGKLNDAEHQETNAKATRDRSAEALESAEGKLNEKRTEIGQQRLKLNGLNAQLDLLLKTHGDDTARSQALIESQAAKIAAQNLLKTTTNAITALQPEMLEVDRKRIARAINEKTDEQNDARTRIAVAQAALRSDGSEDPATNLATAEAKVRSASEYLGSVQRHSQAIALLD